MKYRKYLLSFLAICTLFKVQAREFDAHQHGVVQLDIATDQNTLLIMVNLPAESIIGFEYKPQTRHEVQHLEKIKQTFKHQLLTYFGQKSLSDCEISQSTWEQKFSGKSHSNIHLESYIKCQKPIRGRSLSISLKKNYPRVERVKVQLMREDSSVINRTYEKEIFPLQL